MSTIPPELQPMVDDLSRYPEMTDFCMKGDSLCAINKLAFTYAIISEITYSGYGDRWCYSSYEKAKQALDNWGAEDAEPQGWHRHPATGRRRPDGDETKQYINY